MISKKQSQILNKVIKRYDLELIVLFGSRAKNQEREDSDYDIAIYSKKNLKKVFWKIWSEIEGNFFPKIDLVIINDEIDPLLANNIFKNSICLFEKKEGVYNQMQVNAIFNYIDYSQLYDIEKEIVQNRLNTY